MPLFFALLPVPLILAFITTCAFKHRVVKQIGSGHFGTVSMGVWLCGVKGHQVEVAVKAVKGSSELERIKLLQEAAIMGQFAHCNVVRLLGV